MKKILALALLSSGCLAITPMVNATTADEETGRAAANGRTAGSHSISNGNFNINQRVPEAVKAEATTPVVATTNQAIISRAPAVSAQPTKPQIMATTSMRHTVTSTIPAATLETAPVQMAAAPMAMPVAAPMGAPANARPGECYGQVTIPARYQTTTDKVLVEPASKTIARIVPAQYSTETATVTVADASEELITIPATYRTVTETVVVTPESTRMTKVPATYTTKTERVMVSPARTEWKKGEGPNQRVDASTGDIMCLVEVPAVYKDVTKRVLVTAETTREQVIPAVTKVITKRVVDQPARVERRTIPAVTQQITKQVLVKPEEAVYQETPAQYRTVNKQQLVSPEQITWSQILCKTNANASTVKSLQNALRSKGYNPGDLDGVLGDSTYAAVYKFQKDKNLHRGQITMETLRALGLQS